MKLRRRRDPQPPAPERRGEILLTVPEAAARLCVARSTVYALMTAGELASVRVGRARRIPESAVDRFIAERTK